MYTQIPKEWRTFDSNVTIDDLNDLLVQLHIPTIVFIVALMIVGVFGNILVLYIYTTKYPSSVHRCFILWLAWIDLLACMVGMPLLLVSMAYPYKFPSEPACKTFRFLHVFSVVSSAFIVVTIAIERHRRVCYPFSREMSNRKIKLMCLIASVLGALVAIPAILVYGESTVETGVANITGHECFVDPDYEDTSLPRLFFLFLLVLTVICLIILAIFYFRIGLKIWYHHKFIRENTYSAKKKSDDKSKAKTKKGVVCTNNGLNDSVASTDDDRTPTEDGNTKFTRASTPLKDAINNDVTPKEAPFGERRKKVVKIKDKSRSPSPAVENNKQVVTVCGKQGEKSNKNESGPSLRTRQVTTMLFIITVVFVLAFLPHLTLMVMNSMTPNFMDDPTPAGIVFYNFFLRSFVINNMANPIIYGFCDKKFRSECADLGGAILWCVRG